MLLKPKMLLFSKRIMKFYTLFKTQDLENHTLFSGTYPYKPNEGVPPSPPPRARVVALLKNVRILCIKFCTPRLSVGQYYQAIFGRHLVDMTKKSKFLSKELNTSWALFIYWWANHWQADRLLASSLGGFGWGMGENKSL